MEWSRGDFRLSDETADVQAEAVQGLLRQSYWARERSAETIVETLKDSLNFSLFHQGGQIGFARMITDRVTYAYLCDVIIDEGFRGQGLGQWMLGCILEHPELQVDRITLRTRDAHGLYAKFGFKPCEAMVRENAEHAKGESTWNPAHELSGGCDHENHL